jgi:hypothetical protein
MYNRTTSMLPDNGALPLYYLSSFAGLFMIVGGIWLLYKQKIYIDKETNQVTEIETPIGKFRTNVPALMLFALGFVPLIYPLFQLASSTREIRIHGNVQTDSHPLLVYAVATSDSSPQGGDFSVSLPLLKNVKNCKILYVVENVIDEAEVDLARANKGDIALGTKVMLPSASGTPVRTLAAVPSEFIR